MIVVPLLHEFFCVFLDPKLAVDITSNMIQIRHKIESNLFQRIIVEGLVVKLTTTYTFLKYEDNTRSKPATDDTSRHIFCHPLGSGSTQQVNTRTLCKLHTTRKCRSSDLTFPVEHIRKESIHLRPALNHKLAELWRENGHCGVIALDERGE